MCRVVDFYFVMIIDLRIVLRNNIESSPVHFPVSHNGNMSQNCWAISEPGY